MSALSAASIAAWGAMSAMSVLASGVLRPKRAVAASALPIPARPPARFGLAVISSLHYGNR